MRRPNLTPGQSAGKLAFNTVTQRIDRHRYMLPIETQTQLLRTAANAIREAVANDDPSQITDAKTSTLEAIRKELTKI